MAANPVSPTPVLTLETEKTPQQITVHCSGRFVSDTCAQLQSTVRPLLSETKSLVLDLTGVNYIDSSALGAIVGLKLSSKRAGCRLTLINLTPRVKELFSMTRLTEVLGEHEGMLGATPD
ncbi:MAG: STAS domain-containing protein [Terriglobales bacterium]